MANKTDFLNLVLPANNEYNNAWDVPMNKNFTLIDQEIESVSNEILSARFSLPTLAEFLNIAHFDDGTLKPSDELDDARNSSIYGDDDGAGEDFKLRNRLELSDREIWDSREGLESLSVTLARRSRDFDHPDRVINAAKDGEGQPNFLASSGSEFQLNGSPTMIEFNIDGFYMRLRTDETTNVTGGDGTRYLYAQKPANPITVLDRTTQAAASTITNPLNNDKVQILQDPGIDFTTIDVKAGDVLELLNTPNAGEYIIAEIAPDGETDQIKIIGRFVNVITAINYKISDPLKPELDIDTEYVELAGKCYIGEGEFTSGALISSLTYNFKGKYSGPFTAIDVSSLAVVEKVFNHNLGEFPSDIQIFVSKANDGSEPLEPLSFAKVGNDLAVSINDTYSFSPGTWDAGTSDANYAPLPSLSGGVSGALSGSVHDLRSVSVKVTKTQIFIKNVKDNHLYRDYDGTDQNSGFFKVVCKK